MKTINKTAIIDCRLSEKCKKALENLGFTLFCIEENPNLDNPISAHPDISVLLCKNSIIAESGVYRKLKEHLFLTGDCRYNILEGCRFDANTLYPKDCKLNFAVCGKHLIGKMSCLCDIAAQIADENSLIKIDVNQGYAKCNIVVVNDNAIITEDKGIAKKCTESGIEVLLLESNEVKLHGYKNGFIGGATGRYKNENDENIILFCGDVSKHSEYKRIEAFCKSHGAVPVSLSDEPLYDYGSIIIL